MPHLTPIGGSIAQRALFGAIHLDALIRSGWNDAALKILEGEGSAVAFAEVFQQVKADMKAVKNRLAKVDTGKVTVTIENDIIETL